MKIAVATNNRKTIAKRTGRASEFAIYHIDNNQINRIEYRENKHAHHHHDDDEHQPHEGRHGRGDGHGHGRRHHEHHHEHGHHSHDEVVETLKDIDMLLVRAVGKYMRQDLIDGKIPFQRVAGENISDVIQNYLKSQETE